MDLGGGPLVVGWGDGLEDVGLGDDLEEDVGSAGCGFGGCPSTIPTGNV